MSTKKKSKNHIPIKRPLTLAFLTLSIDQLLKFYFQYNFNEKTIIFWDKWGFTYITNPGLWVKSNVTVSQITIIQILILITVFIIFFLTRYYEFYYRKSIWIDLTFSFYVTSCFGNVIIDRMVFGYIRDYLITPIAISNLADFSWVFGLVCLLVEVILYPKSREIFKWRSPKYFFHDVRAFLKFLFQYVSGKLCDI